MIAFDTETHPIEPGNLCPKFVCCSTANEEGASSHTGLPYLGEVVGCNIAYDMAVIHEHMGVDVWQKYARGEVHDVAIREMLMDTAKGLRVEKSYSLESLVMRRFGVQLDKDPEIRLTFHKGITDKHIAYSKADAEWTWKVWYAQELEANDPGNIKLKQALTFEQFECEAAFCLHLMSVYGMIADKPWVEQLLKDAQVKYDALQQKFRELGVLRDDGTKDKKFLQALVTKAYNGNPPRTAKGGVKTDRLTLEESGDPTLQELTGDGPIEKIITNYGKVLLEACEHPYNARYNVLVSSGRTSGNFQQWPRGGQKAPPEVSRLRASFIPRKGKYYCAVDLQAAELVALAEVCYKVVGWSKLRDSINLGQDLHTALAARLAGISYEEAIKRIEAGDKVLSDLRQSCKPINFGLPGMMGAPRLVQAAQKEGTHFCELAGSGVGCVGSSCRKCLDLAYRYIRAWKSQWPEVPAYHAWIATQNLDPFVDPITGWVSGGLYPSEAANRPFQHLTSRAAKLALIEVTRACYNQASPLYGCKPVMFAHDEIMLEIDYPAQGDFVAQIVQEAAQSVTPNVLAKASPVVMLRWYKGAKTVRNEKGELQVWEPKK